MPLEVKKQGRENTQSLLRRFSKAIKRSGILKEARKIRYKQRPLSRKKKKELALRRERMKKEYERKDKLGLIKNKYGRR